MDWRKVAVFVRLTLVATALCWAANHVVRAQSKGQVDQTGMPKIRSTTQAQRKAAAANKKKAGLVQTGAAAKGKAAGLTARAAAVTALAPSPGSTPDYFGPFSNWANSPLPGGPVAAVTLVSGGTGYCSTPTITISDLYGMGVGATASVTAVDGNGTITGITFTGPSGSGYVYPVVAITDCANGTGTGAVATATLDPTPATLTGGLAKFVDAVPNLVIATPDVVTYPGSAYYEIEVSEYTNWQFHTSLPATTLRGYRQTNNGTNVYSASNTSGCGPSPAPHVCTVADNTVAPPAAFSYLGPTIVAVKGQPTRVKFTNNLPLTANGGDLFIPTDTTVMGAGSGYDPKTNSMGTYTQNRATLHLHGGFTPWVSDGTPHQWVTPAGESGVLTSGVSTQPVPDMALPAGDSMTFYWPNQQSGRLMFYHDHAYGITRLNVYAGEAAGYLLVDPVERALTDGTTPGIPAMADVPLVIQDKTFVWGTGPGTGTWATDPTWNWGQTPGSLWFPHVYMPNQNPWDMTGANAMGRWDYALWFWPPFTGLLAHGTVPNPYADASAPWEPPEIPGTPNPSLVPEAFLDTPVVNGKAYPTLSVPAGPVRFRILNAANDRFWNLSLFVAADKTSPTAAGTTGAVSCTGSVSATNCTEVAMVQAVPGAAAFPTSWSAATDGGAVKSDILDARVGGVPDPAHVGPSWIQIGTEGGLLPAPVVIPPSPIGYQYNPRNIVIGNVTKHSLFLGPAERADVIVDFSGFAGQTLILYNDSPAPVPALDSRIDYYTGDPDQTDTGGAPPTLPGYGPNTRTIMQIQVASTAGTSLNLAALQAAFASTATAQGAFAKSQDPILVAQSAYNSAYNGTFPSGVANPAAFARIQDTSMNFATVNGTTLSAFPLQPKAIQELFELDYGRMNATLGVELPFTNGGNQTTLPMGYIEPATEIINTSGAAAAPPSLGDGTQLWKITHNGVDTHAIHVHLFNVQVVNRVGWDGAIRPPEPNELGWKETVRMNPLEDIIVALRPTTPQLPFGLPNSVRLMSPSMAPGTLIDTFDTSTGNPTTVPNAIVDFGWEYVWHCHLLGHEENDMMRPTVFNVPSTVPLAPTIQTAARNGSAVNLTWLDSTPFDYTQAFPQTNLGNPANEIGFLVQRAPVGNNGRPGAYAQIGTALANATTFADLNAGAGTLSYRVVAYNAAGSATSAAVTVTAGAAAPAAPTNMVATLQAGPQIRLTWTDNANNETSFAVERQVGGGAFAPLVTLGTNVTTYTDTTVTAGNTYTYRVRAVNATGSSAFATSSPVPVPMAPTAPSGLTATATRLNRNNDTVRLNWADNSNNETGFNIQRCTGSAATCGPTAPGWANVTTTAANVTTFSQSVARGRSFCYRIRSVNLGGSSAWVNATPFPVITP